MTTTNDKTYHCEICHGINAAARLTCKHCGTIPARYTALRKPSKAVVESGVYIEVCVAFGCERQNFTHATAVKLRNVPLDYYAEI